MKCDAIDNSTLPRHPTSGFGYRNVVPHNTTGFDIYRRSSCRSSYQNPHISHYMQCRWIDGGAQIAVGLVSLGWMDDGWMDADGYQWRENINTVRCFLESNTHILAKPSIPGCLYILTSYIFQDCDNSTTLINRITRHGLNHLVSVIPQRSNLV